MKYVRHLYKSGADYSTVNFHRSVISKFHVGIYGIPKGEHPLVSQAVFRLRPPLPQYQSTFDIVPVLAYIQSLPIATISLQLLSFKALFLTIYSSISRVSNKAHLAPLLEETRDSVVLKLVSIEKQARAGKVRVFFQIPKFPEDLELCPVRVLSTYSTKVRSANFGMFSNYSLMSLQVSGICGDNKLFFVSFVKPHRSVTSKTLARWLKSVLASTGVDDKLWVPHSVRSSAFCHLSTVKNLDLGKICKLADWSMTSGTILKFYQRYV